MIYEEWSVSKWKEMTTRAKEEEIALERRRGTSPLSWKDRNKCWNR